MALYGIKDCANLTLFDLSTSHPDLYSDYANVSTNEWTSERVYANAKGSRAIAWDSDRQSTLQVEMETFELKWLAVVAGSEIQNGENDVAKREIIRVGENKTAQLKGTPVEGSVQIIPVGKDEIEHIGEPLTEIPVPNPNPDPDSEEESGIGADQFTVDGGEITFASDAIEGQAYAVYYLVKDTGVKTITISKDKFPKAYRIVADTLIREKETGRDEFVQIEFPNARPQSNFTITMSATEPTNLSVTFDLFPNKDGEIAVYKVIGD